MSSLGWKKRGEEFEHCGCGQFQTLVVRTPSMGSGSSALKVGQAILDLAAEGQGKTFELGDVDVTGLGQAGISQPDAQFGPEGAD